MILREQLQKLKDLADLFSSLLFLVLIPLNLPYVFLVVNLVLKSLIELLKEKLRLGIGLEIVEERLLDLGVSQVQKIDGKVNHREDKLIGQGVVKV